ncbi:MAG: TonB-dependent receptor [Candidatus Cryptobacteroides sp.]|nr:TonB-dependent receptor [Candidatus Cryptobacteroides sp.]
MRGLFFILTAAIAAAPAFAGNPSTGNDGVADSHDKVEKLDSVIVSASRAGKSTPVTYTMVGKEQLRSSNPINSLPMQLNLTPSAVAVNEGGTGIGYSKMTVRGSKGSQINVTLNGITLNDAESQEVFWVNIPSLSNILSSVQVQRGLGTSANGAGAFGASINMSTAAVGIEPYAAFDVAAGSYNTFMTTVSAGTGLTRSGVYFDVAYSRNYTDGYIRNAKAKVQSAFAALGWMNERNSLKLTYLMGDQHTGITWNGIDISMAYDKEDRKYNEAGQYYDELGNVRYYDNDTDNYTQHHLQLNYTRQFGERVYWSTTLNWTKGDGWYENYKADKKFTKYGFPSDFTFTRDGVEYTASSASDFIIRKSMANNYYVVNSDVKYKGDKLNITGGVNLSQYNGNHYGEVLWNEILGDDYDYDGRYPVSAENEWYYSRSIKREANLFARAEYSPIACLTAYLDLQYRGVSLKMSGIDDEDDLDIGYKTSWNFFNPRAGLTFRKDFHKVYASAALGNREPGRSDIKEVIITNNLGGSRPDLKPEKMVDVEIGYEFASEKVTASANLYFMEYFDMLLETGRLSDVGYAIKENVGRAYRRGAELAVAWQAAPWVRLDANATLSMNRIRNYVEYYTVIDDDWNEKGQKAVEYGTTRMLMSPSVVGLVQLSFTPFRTVCSNSLKTTALTLNGKYVGKQFLDNTATDSRSIPGYYVMNLSLTHEFSLRHGKLGLGAYVNNLLNNMYIADGWCWKNMMESDGSIVDGVGVFPQAPANFMIRASYSF